MELSCEASCFLLHTSIGVNDSVACFIKCYATWRAHRTIIDLLHSEYPPGIYVRRPQTSSAADGGRRHLLHV